MNQPSGDYDLLNHYSVLIYPFLHDVVGDERNKRLETLDKCWMPWWGRVRDEQLAATLDDTYFFLPHIRNIIFPETVRLQNEPAGPNNKHWINLIMEWRQENLPAFCSAIKSDAILRLTSRPEFHEKLKILRLEQYSAKSDSLDDKESFPIKLEWMDAMLFPTGIGFLILKVNMAEAQPRLSGLINMNYHLRLIHPPKADWNLPRISVENLKTSHHFRDFINFLLQGMVTDYAPCNFDLREFMENCDRSECIRYTDSEPGQVYGERWQLLSYACIDVERESLGNGDESSGRNLGPGPFPCVQDRLLYEFATCLQLNDSVNNSIWRPSPAYAEHLLKQNIISVWNCWRGMALKESTVFLGTEDNHFNRTGLAYNIENDYLPLYLYTLYQKYQLYVFSNELMREGASEGSKRLMMKKLADQVVAFRRLYYFNEITRKPMGDELYQKFQLGLGIPALNELVGSEVTSVYQYYEERYRQHISRLLDLLTFIFLPLSALIGIFGMTFFNGSWKSFLIGLGAVSTVSFVIWIWWKKIRH